MTNDQIIGFLRSSFGEFWTSLSAAQQQNLVSQISQSGNVAPDTISPLVVASSDYTNWYTNYSVDGTTTTPPAEYPVPTATTEATTSPEQNTSGDLTQSKPGDPGYVPPPATPAPPPAPEPPPPAPGDSQLLAQITSLLAQWGLPSTLTAFIQAEITGSKSFDEIINDLRATPEYQAAFPENPLRIANGYSTMTEQQILEYRDQAKQIAMSTLGITDVSTAELTNLIANNKSLSEWASNLQTYATFERWGPYVKQALSQELGYDVSDERVFAFLSPDIATSELDEAYTRALIRGEPAVLGFGIRPEAEADILLAHGINPEQAFAGYQGIASEMPREQRLAMIDAAVQGANLPDASTALSDTTFGELFKAIQLRDPAAINRISQTIARETARWQAGGGAARSGTTAVGLLSPDERANF